MPGKIVPANQSSSFSPARAVAATVTVIDQHGKVVQNGSKSFFSALREAKQAYRNRKLEIAAERQAERRAREAVMRGGPHVAALPAARAPLAIQNTPAAGPSKKSKKHRKHRHAPDSPVCDNHGDDGIQEDALVSTTGAAAVQPHHHTRDDGPCEDVLVRGDTAMAVASAAAATQALAPAIFNDPTVVAVQALLTRVQSIIDEIQCWAVGLSTLITELQKTPETFAAVGLSLAEIAQLVTHITPAATIILKSAFPTIFALISSPHFTFVAGVGAAATVVVLGGYKIVRSIIGGAEENIRLAESDADHLMAYGDLPDEDILEETTLGGEIIGEVIEDRLLEASCRRDSLDGDYVAFKSPASKHERKMSTASADTALVKLERKESRWGKKEKPLKDERKHDSKDREERRERKKEKEERARRKEDGGKPVKPERRGTLPRQSSNSSGMSTSGDDDRSRKSPRIGSGSGSSSPKSSGSRSPKVGSSSGSSKSPKIGSDGKERKSPKIGSEGKERKKEKPVEEEKKKKRNIIKSLFSIEGRSA